MKKTCSKCGLSKEPVYFYPDVSKKSGLSSQCKACQKLRSRQNYHADPEKGKAYRKAYYQQNKDKFIQHARSLREEVLREYGGRCVCCGETTSEFLGIDHIFNDGESHRRQMSGYGRSIYRWLKNNGYPKDRFQLLCHNCNMAKGLYGGCPHQGPVPGRRQATMRWDKPVPAPAIQQRDDDDEEHLQVRKELDYAVEFLKVELRDGPVTVDRIHVVAAKNRIAVRTLRRAREKLQIQTIKQGVDWYWSLDER